MSNLDRQLDLYEKGDLEALETILTPSLYSGSNRTDVDLEVEQVLNQIGGRDGEMVRERTEPPRESEANKPISIVQGGKMSAKQRREARSADNGSGDSGSRTAQESGNSAGSRDRGVNNIIESAGKLVTKDGDYPKITNAVKEEINRIATEWIRLDEGLEKLNATKRELLRQQKLKEAALLNYIESYGLKDITKGRHQLVPQVIKGKRKGTNKKSISDGLKEFLSTLDIGGEDPDELAAQATDFIENAREMGDDRVKLQHNKL